MSPPRCLGLECQCRECRNTNRISAFGNRFHFTTHISILLLLLLLNISITYYIYISKFIETILREKKIELDREVPQTIGVTWPKPDGVETRAQKNKIGI